MDQQESGLHELVYVSRRARHVSDENVVDQIVLPAMRVNRDRSITGVLWFDPERFLQILEGPPDEVHRTFDSIRRDPRHSDIDVLCDAPLENRSFERWGMRAVVGRHDDGIDPIIRVYQSRPRHAVFSAPTAETPSVLTRLRSLLLRGADTA